MKWKLEKESGKESIEKFNMDLVLLGIKVSISGNLIGIQVSLDENEAICGIAFSFDDKKDKDNSQSRVKEAMSS